MSSTTPSFADLGAPAPIVEVLSRKGIIEPFAIQAAVLGDAFAGRDILGRAPTGSGKTLAFGIPVVAGMREGRRRRPTALILSPTRELADQIADELRPLAKAMGHTVAAIYGGVGYKRQREAIDNGASLIVACPGRLEDLLQMKALRLDGVDRVVIDEADRMADMGFLPAVRRIVELTTPDRHMMLFSATLEGPVAKLTRDFQRNPARHEVGSSEPDMTLAQHLFWTVDRSERAAETARFVSDVGPTVVFTRTRHGADRLAKQLGTYGVVAAPIHGGRNQSQRTRTLRDFASGRVHTLVATDVAARGIHVDGVAGVVHFDPPEDAATYVHRSGRTARAGATGVVLSLVEPSARKATTSMQKALGLPVGVTEVDPSAVLAPTPAGGTTRPAPAAVATRPAPSTQSRESKGPNGSKAAVRKRPTPRPDRSSRRSDTAASGAMKGKVAYYSDRKGFGFISVYGQDDVFVHASGVASDGHVLAEGQRVAFDLAPGKKGPMAVNVRPVATASR